MIIAGHILLPHQANWASKPNFTRIWKSTTESALDGTENRMSVRGTAWMKLSYSVFPYNHVERAKFDDAFRAALRVGKIAVPHWGRGVKIESATSTTATLSRSNHGIVAGDFVFIQSPQPDLFDTWDAPLVDSVSGATLTFADSIQTYARARVWPLLFGKPLVEPFAARNSALNLYTVAVQYDGRNISAEAFDDFSSYPLGEAGTLNGGTGWDGAWTLSDIELVELTTLVERVTSTGDTRVTSDGFLRTIA